MSARSVHPKMIGIQKVGWDGEEVREEDEYRHHKLDRGRTDCRDPGQADHAGQGPRRLPADDRHRDDRSTARRVRRAVARREGSNGFNIWSILVATLGAIILLALYRAFAGG